MSLVLVVHCSILFSGFFGLFIFIVSLIVTVVATVVETVYDIAGCCGLSFTYLCNFESNFENKRERVKRRSEAVDKKLDEGNMFRMLNIVSMFKISCI